MARTYRSEGQRLANILRPLFILGSLIFYHKFFYPENFEFDNFVHIGTFFFFLTLGAAIPQIIGNMWSSYRRANKKASKRAPRSRQNQNVSRPRQQSNNLSSKELLMADIDTLSGDDFERLMAMYFKWKGYEVQIIGGSGDHGVDLVMLDKKDGYKIAVQCKRWKNNVGNEVIHNVNSGKRMYDCLAAWVVTTSYFTPMAKEAAERNRVRLINGIEVHEMINSMRKHYGITRTKSRR